LATRTSLMDFQIPRIVHEELDENRGIFVIEPLDRGFGYTFGNSLRRVLLSSLEGAAVTAVKIEGVAHEFTTLPGVTEDVTDIILNLKSLVCRLYGESPEIEVHIAKKGEGVVTAADIEAPADLEILNPDLEIAHLSGKGKLELTLTIGRGRGYVPAELNRGPETTIGVIPIDSIFSPVRRVAYDVEAARVGQRTDYDKLRLDVTTDGSLEPRDAIGQAAEILIKQLMIFTDMEFERPGAAEDERPASRRSRTGWRTSRSRSSSSASARTTASSASGSRRSATWSRRPRASLRRSPTSAASRSRRSRRPSRRTG
jgi:DNA-directed RNA polymerase subunit alpha